VAVDAPGFGSAKRLRSGSEDRDTASKTAAIVSSYVYASDEVQSQLTTRGGGRKALGVAAYGYGKNLSITDDESIKRWKNRLWPTAALLAFVRAITFCRLTSTGSGQHSQHFTLHGWWTLGRPTSVFENCRAYAAYFFLNILEECKESFSGSNSENTASNTDVSSRFAIGIVREVEVEAEINLNMSSQLTVEL
jgi:hypothetical protein